MMMQLGELSAAMAQNTFRHVEKIINEKRHLSKFWIFIYPRLTSPNVLHERIVIMPCKPVYMLGTIGLEIDNIRGTIELLWKYPLDIPLPDIQTEGYDPEIARAAQENGIILGDWN